MPRQIADPLLPIFAHRELAGKWVAWDSEHAHIVAHADTLPLLWQVIRDEQIVEPIVEKLPPADVRLVGRR